MRIFVKLSDSTVFSSMAKERIPTSCCVYSGDMMPGQSGVPYIRRVFHIQVKLAGIDIHLLSNTQPIYVHPRHMIKSVGHDCFVTTTDLNNIIVH